MQKPLEYDFRGIGLLFRGALFLALLLSQLVQAANLYVAADSQQPTAPFQSWEPAAATIQETISQAHPGDIVLVTNGTCRTGLAEYSGTYRIALTNAITVRSVSGAGATLVLGDTNGARCAYVAAGAELSGFTFTQGRAPRFGGGGVLVSSGGGTMGSTISLTRIATTLARDRTPLAWPPEIPRCSGHVGICRLCDLGASSREDLWSTSARSRSPRPSLLPGLPLTVIPPFQGGSR